VLWVTLARDQKALRKYVMSDMRFDGRVVLITGAGAAWDANSTLFAARGAKVVVSDVGGISLAAAPTLIPLARRGAHSRGRGLPSLPRGSSQERNHVRGADGA